MKNEYHELLVWLGINLPNLVAGMFGGVVKALLFHRDSPAETVFSGIIGGLTANYLGDAIASKVGAGSGATSFGVGLTAMVLCQVIIDRVRKWSKNDGAKDA